MKFRKMVSAALVGTMLLTSMGFNAIADDEMEEIVYSYVDETGETINITQSDLDAEHWNKNALGNTAPFLYEEFPMRINSYVNDYSDLKLEIKYLKTNDAELTVEDIIDDTVIYSEDVTTGISYIPVEVNKVYKLTLSENIDGVITESYRAVTTSIVEAEMPSYITENTASNSTILIGNLDDLRASEYVDEDGETIIDGTMHRYDKVTADDFSNFCSDLEEDSIYRVYTKDEDEKKYTGFISTYNDGIDYIYIPAITTCNWEDYRPVNPIRRIAPSSTNSLLAPITASDIQNAYKRDISMYRDYTFTITNSTTNSSRFKVFELIPVGTAVGTQPSFDLNINTTCPFTIETWVDIGNTGTPVYSSTNTVTTTSANFEFIMSAYVNGVSYALTESDRLYYVIYFPSNVTGRGDISLQQSTFYDDNDTTGSAYEAYNDPNSLEVMPTTQYTLYDWRDVDAFYIKYTSSTSQRYRIVFWNLDTEEDEDQYIKTMEVATKTAGNGFDVSASPDDIFDVDVDAGKTYNLYISSSNPTFVYVYDSITGIRGNVTNLYSLRYYKR